MGSNGKSQWRTSKVQGDEKTNQKKVVVHYEAAYKIAHGNLVYLIKCINAGKSDI